MTEIPLPPSDGYVEPSAPSKGPGCGKMLIVGLIVAIVVVGGFIVVMLPSLGNGNTTTTTTTTPITTTTTTTEPFDVRVIEYNFRVDIELVDTTYYAGEFLVYSSEVQTAIAPDLRFTIIVWDYGSDPGPVDVHIAVYETDENTVLTAPTWADLNSYLMDQGTYEAPVTEFINLHNIASTYTWVMWFEGTTKTSVWEVSTYLDLRYNWDL